MSGKYGGNILVSQGSRVEEACLIAEWGLQIGVAYDNAKAFLLARSW